MEAEGITQRYVPLVTTCVCTCDSVVHVLVSLFDVTVRPMPELKSENEDG